MIKLTNYLYDIGRPDSKYVLGERILYLYNSEHNTYFTATIYPANVDDEGAIYQFADEPWSDFSKLKVVKSWRTDDLVSLAMCLDSLMDQHGESEV